MNRSVLIDSKIALDDQPRSRCVRVEAVDWIRTEDPIIKKATRLKSRLELEELTAKDVRSRFPRLGPDAIAASFSPNDGSGNPRLIAPAFASATRKLGADIIENVDIGAIRKRAYGFQVETSKGSHEASMLLNTTGAWGARRGLVRRDGSDYCQRPANGSDRTSPPSHSPGRRRLGA